MIFGAVKRLPAVDAAPLHQLNMILVLGLNGYRNSGWDLA